MKLNCSLCFIVSGVRLIKGDYRNRTVGIRNPVILVVSLNFADFT